MLPSGNFKHPPNMDSVKWLAEEIWCKIRSELQGRGIDARLDVYGAYPSAEALRLHNPSKGLHVLGHAPSLDIMANYRVCLAPLRFGAGLKGKVLDSWWHGAPRLCPWAPWAEIARAVQRPQAKCGSGLLANPLPVRHEAAARRSFVVYFQQGFRCAPLRSERKACLSTASPGTVRTGWDGPVEVTSILSFCWLAACHRERNASISSRSSHQVPFERQEAWRRGYLARLSQKHEEETRAGTGVDPGPPPPLWTLSRMLWRCTQIRLSGQRHRPKVHAGDMLPGAWPILPVRSCVEKLLVLQGFVFSSACFRQMGMP